MNINDEMMDQLAVQGLGRLLYLQYCEHRNFDPKPVPYVPGWAVDYARVSIEVLGFDEDGFKDVLTRAGMGGE